MGHGPAYTLTPGLVRLVIMRDSPPTQWRSRQEPLPAATPSRPGRFCGHDSLLHGARRTPVACRRRGSGLHSGRPGTRLMLACRPPAALQLGRYGRLRPKQAKERLCRRVRQWPPRIHPRRDACPLEATDRLDSGKELPPKEREELLDRLRGFEEAAQQRMADLRSQLARTEELAATLRQRLPVRTAAPVRTP